MPARSAGRKIVFILLALALVREGQLVRAQFTPSEIAQREQWEEFLKTADIVKVEDIDEGVTKPWKVYLKKGDLEKQAAFKYARGMLYGYEEGWQYEIAAYRMDKILELNMIPPAVEREVTREDGDLTKGALSLWTESKTSLINLTELGELPPPPQIMPNS